MIEAGSYDTPPFCTNIGAVATVIITPKKDNSNKKALKIGKAGQECR